MKAILISVQPKWCRLIKSGEKKLEIRKTRPKIDTPFKCYIYETQGRKWQNKNEPPMQEGFGMVVGEFVCDFVVPIFGYSSSRFWIVEPILRASCLTTEQIISYGASSKEIYGLHISDLKIYDKPKPLSEFGLKRAPMSWGYVCL